MRLAQVPTCSRSYRGQLHDKTGPDHLQFCTLRATAVTPSLTTPQVWEGSQSGSGDMQPLQPPQHLRKPTGAGVPLSEWASVSRCDATARLTALFKSASHQPFHCPPAQDYCCHFTPRTVLTLRTGSGGRDSVPVGEVIEYHRPETALCLAATSACDSDVCLRIGLG